MRREKRRGGDRGDRVCWCVCVGGEESRWTEGWGKERRMGTRKKRVRGEERYFVGT